MYFGKLSIILLIVSCVAINAQKSMKRKMMKSKTKFKKPSLASRALPGCGCQNPLMDILNCGCRGPVIEPVYAPISPMELSIPSFPGPIIDVPNYRYADPLELNPLGCLFPTIEVTNCGILSTPMSVPSVELFAPVDLPCGCSGTCNCPKTCGCPGPKCGCRAPAVKLPACPCESLAGIDVPKCGCGGQKLQLPSYSYGISSVIELPSYGPGLMPSGSCRGSPCGCQGSCSCAGLPMSACECLGPCGCSGVQISSCGCSGPCSCTGIPMSSCECLGPCSCAGLPMLSSGCSGSCGCGGIPMSSCSCVGPCSCSGMPASSCGCSGPCGCGMSASSCGCLGPCGCPGIQMPSYGYQLPAIEVPSCGCGCGLPGCGCSPKYIRKVTLQPPFL